MTKTCDALLGAALAAILLAPVPVLAADAAGEIVTAATHADLAAKASDLAGTQMHLHHALNCLVGPGGAGFDPKNLNPCAGSGNGAIPDTADAAKKKSLMAPPTSRAPAWPRPTRPPRRVMRSARRRR